MYIDRNMNRDMFEAPLFKFYKLKDKYESDFQKAKSKILTNKELSVREKRSRLKLLKPKCVKCRRPVGTIFSTLDHKLVALCGSTSDPCPLNINIHRGDIILLDGIVKAFSEGVEEKKTDIMKVKLNLLFNYTDEATALQEFEELKKNMKEDVALLIEKKGELYEVTHKDNKGMNELEMKIAGLREELRTILNALKKDTPIIEKQNRIEEAYHIYERIQPLVEALRNMQYNYYAVEGDNNNTRFNLLRVPVGVVDKEIVIETEPEIVENAY